MPWSLVLTSTQAEVHLRIVNGQPAAAGAWPWMAGLLNTGSDASNVFCGGAVIGASQVLTAAHCVVDYASNPAALEVIVGTTKLSGSGSRLKIAGIVVHPRYNQKTVENDLAILKLETPATAVAGVQPVALASEEETAAYAAGQPATVIGWGVTAVHAPPHTDALNQAVVPVAADDDCQARYGSTFYPDSMFCAGKLASSDGAQDGVDSCYGDSGGPLMAQTADGRYKQIGIVSWGFGCATHSYYGVYTRLAAYSAWVQSNPVMKAYPKSAPLVEGNAAVGSELRCNPGVWGGDGPITYSYQWLRDDRPISGAVSPVYTVSALDVSSSLSCRVTGTNSGGSSIAQSRKTASIKAGAQSQAAQGGFGAPTVSKKRVVKHSREWNVVVSAKDDQGAAAVAGVEARVVYNRNRKKGSKYINALPLAGSSWVFKLTPVRGGVTLYARAYDFAGNVQVTATKIVVR